MDSIHEVSIPVGSLSIIGMKGCEKCGKVMRTCRSGGVKDMAN